MSDTRADRRRLESGHRRAANVRRIIVVLVTTLLIVALSVALVLLKPVGWLVDKPTVTGASMLQRVSQTEYGLYCPQQMTLADDADFGDSEYQATTGDIASSALYAAFGSVYSADVYDYPLASGQDASVQQLSDGDALDSANIKTLAGDVSKHAQYIDARLLEAKSGTGVSGAVATWATTGDIRGVSAASCVTTALSNTFLLPATDTGVTEQLVVANPSQKATSLDITVYGTKHAGALSLSTRSTLTVPAGGQSTWDVAAAAPGQDGVYVTVSSKETPVAAIVNVVRMNGLKPQGSDIVTPLGESSDNLAMPGVNGGDDVTALVYAHNSATVTLSWATADGKVEAQTVSVSARRVSAVDLGKAPDGTLALIANASTPIMVQSTVSQGTSGQADIACIPGRSLQRHAALAVPTSMSAQLDFVNTSDSQASVTVRGYDASGRRVGAKRLDIPSTSAVSVDPADIGGAQLVTLSSAAPVVWGARLTSGALSKANIAQAAYLSASSLEPQSREVVTVNDQRIVR
ncbi:DUF5719 family protein [Bifidobacterium thermophilum]|uniref:DUF5719 family protein n=1 Tax=Bifidobacterium thermophilum TaxID=33905 RepID=UPI00309F21DC